VHSDIECHCDQPASRRLTRWLRLRFDGRSTAYQRSLRSQWRNTDRWPASHSHDDLFIYLFMPQYGSPVIT